MPSRRRRQHDVLAQAAAPDVAATRAAAVLAAAAGVAAARRGVGSQEVIRPRRWWSRIVWVVGTGYVSHRPKAAVPRITYGKNQQKITN